MPAAVAPVRPQATRGPRATTKAYHSATHSMTACTHQRSGTWSRSLYTPQASHPPTAFRRVGSPDVVEILLQRLDPDLPAPAYAHPGDAGADLRSAIDLTLAPGERILVPTGVGIALPEGYVALVHPRSGLAARHGLSIVNTPGTVDAGYRGEIKVLLINTDATESVTLHRGDRIAQLVVQRVERAVFVEVDALPDSARGAGGYGSTGGFTTGDREETA